MYVSSTYTPTSTNHKRKTESHTGHNNGNAAVCDDDAVDDNNKEMRG